MKKVLCLLIVFLIGVQVWAAKDFVPAELDVVYPRKTIVTIKSPSTFFVGSTDPDLPLTINGKPVTVRPSGAFARQVPLNNGKNVFTLVSGTQKAVYIIDRPIPVSASRAKPVFSGYEQPLAVLTTKDNTALRSTPVNAGINRIAHYQKHTPLLVDGHQGDFFRVRLAPDQTAWVFKGDVGVNEGEVGPAALKKQEQADNREFYIFNFEFDRKLPYVIQENPFQVTFYGVSGLDTYTFTPKIPTQKLTGYSGNFHGNKFVLKIRKEVNGAKVLNGTKCLKGMKIAIDAGHGGSESGAIGCFRDLEKNINLYIAKYLEAELLARGADVVMTRHGDSYMGLCERVDAANEKDAVVLVSIHANSLPDNSDPNTHRGTSVYYYYDQAKPLAQSILTAMTTQLGLPDDGVRQASFALTRNTQAVTVLVETAYMINPYDIELLRNKRFQLSAAKAIADGITNYLNK